MKRFRKIFLYGLLGALVLGTLFSLYFFLTLPSVEHLIKKNPKTTAMMEYRKKQALKKKKPLKIKHKWVSFRAIPRLLKRTVITSEDAAFFQHNGVDFYELKESIRRNLKEGKKARGGSTITQQLAKNLFLSPKKSYYRKARELFIAMRLEKHLSKDRILTLYLNVIEFGRGIFGVQAASLHFFKKQVHRLSLVEMVRLIAVLPKPLKVTPVSDSRYLKWRANLLLNRLKHYGDISPRQYKQARKSFN